MNDHTLPEDVEMERLLAAYHLAGPGGRRRLHGAIAARLATLQALHVEAHGRPAGGDYQSLAGSVCESARTGEVWIVAYAPGEASQCPCCGHISVECWGWAWAGGKYLCGQCARPSHPRWQTLGA